MNRHYEEVEPMMATLAGELPTGFGWSYELKWDGVRVLADIRDGTVVLTSRRGNDVTVSYPELAGLAEVLDDALLDGEVVTFAGGRPSFEALQPRMHVRDPKRVAQLTKLIPITYFVFDLLRLDGTNLTGRPYAERRALLEKLPLDGPRWTVPERFDDGPGTLAASRDAGMEGVVAKRVDAPYLPGRRTRYWLKVKHARTMDLVVGGYRRGKGRRSGTLGSLLLGYYEDGRLRYAGHTGTGFSDALLAHLRQRLRPRRTSPFDDEVPREHARDAVWCTPDLVVEIAYGEWTTAGMLRHPRFLRIRDDKAPEECTRVQ
jgi:bifunctional non-homologous end joining protein LigD